MDIKNNWIDHRIAVCEVSFKPRLAKNTHSRPPQIDKRALLNQDTCKTFQLEISNILGPSDPEQLAADELSSKIRTAPVSAAAKVLPAKTKGKFPEEFTPNTVALIHRKRKLWKFLQKSGRRITRSLRDTYRNLCLLVKRSIKLDRNATLEKEAAELSNAFRVCRLKGYSLLKRQHRTRSKAIMPPESDFTNHYRAHYQPGTETPLEIHGCALPFVTGNNTHAKSSFCASRSRAGG